ncbi:MAG: membrane integrity-associated transporter subunit PqiC [Burkholderiales bacterium]|nr:membrane integrity-associated transporter subunit PqiC [Burkholderiales bacterium]
MISRGVLALSLLALGACATPANTRYYTLSAGPPAPAMAASPAPEYSVSIGRVTVPDALDRQQMVLRVAPERYAIVDAERWATPLKREIPQVIAEQMGLRLPAAQVAAYLQYGGQDADYRVLIDVHSFEAVPGESVTLDAAWTVRGRDGALLREARSVFVERVSAAGTGPLVSAHAKALAALAAEIAAAVNPLAPPRR